MGKALDKNVLFQKNVEYVKFSMERLNFPGMYEKQIISYMGKVEESLAVQRDLDEL
jgi:hypothetical protein